MKGSQNPNTRQHFALSVHHW